MLTLLLLLLTACGSDLAQVESEGVPGFYSPIELIQVRVDGNTFHLAKDSRGKTVYETSGYPVGYMGYLPTSGSNGTVRIYSCKIGGDNFVSRRSDCEGQTSVDGSFSLYSGGGDDRAPLYRCFDIGQGNHFMLRNQSCGGHVSEGLLGFVRTSAY